MWMNFYIQNKILLERQKYIIKNGYISFLLNNYLKKDYLWNNLFLPKFNEIYLQLYE